MAHQVRTISRRRLGEAYGTLTDPELRAAVQRAARLYLDLD
jgi:hypothetical protein